MAIDIYNTPAPMPDDGGAIPGAKQMPAPYIQGGANGSFGSDAEEGHQKLIRWSDTSKTVNIADELDDEQLNAIGQRCQREFDIDHNTRSDWEDRSEVAIELAMQVTKDKTTPWPGASNVIYPLMTLSAVQFGARAYPAIVQGRNVVKGIVTGPDKGIPQIGPDGQPMMQPGPDGQPQPVWAVPPNAKRDRAKRIGEHMSWQLLEEMKEWSFDTDRMLHILPIVGTTFRKVYFNPTFGCNVAKLVLAQNLVVNHWAPALERAPRLTEILQMYPHEIEEMVRSDLFLSHEYGTAENSNGDDEAPHDFYEQHRLLDLDEDGYPEPYVVTLHKGTSKVARIVARYDPDGVHISRAKGEVIKIDPVHYYTQYTFLPALDGGIMGTGFGQLLGPINKSVNTTLNMLFDAEHLKITGGGFIGRGLSQHSGSLKFKLGEWKMVNSPGQAVRDAIVPLNHPGASPVLFTLLGFLVEAGKEIASVKDVLAGETAAATMQPTTLLALIEQGLKVFTAIYKRVHDSAKTEFDKLYRLNRIYLEHQAKYQVGDEWKTVTREDYAKGAGVKPYSDPQMVSDMQRMARAQFLQSYQNDPMCDGVEIRKQVFEAAQIEGADKIVHGQMPPNPELMAKAAEMELRGEEAKSRILTEKAKQANTWADTLKKLAETDKINGEMPLEWTAQYIDLLTAHMDSLLQPAEGRQQGGPPAPHPDEVMPPPPPQRSLSSLGDMQQMMAPQEAGFEGGVPYAEPGASSFGGQ